jgi:dethiobiotin synthetase
MANKKEFDRPPGKGIFITGTDTGVGKTMVTAAIARSLAGKGLDVEVFKPIATGCLHRREGLVNSDAEFLAHWANSKFSLEQINPVRYSQALSPFAAARVSGVEIDWQAVQLSYHNLLANSEILLVEGIGGVMVPLEKDYMVIDMMADMGLGVLVVAENKLGVLNHAALTISACKTRGLEVLGVVFNRYCAAESDLAQETNAAVLEEVCGVRVIAVIAYDADSCVEDGRMGDDVFESVNMVDWVEYLS